MSESGRRVVSRIQYTDDRGHEFIGEVAENERGVRFRYGWRAEALSEGHEHWGVGPAVTQELGERTALEWMRGADLRDLLP